MISLFHAALITFRYKIILVNRCNECFRLSKASFPVYRKFGFFNAFIHHSMRVQVLCVFFCDNPNSQFNEISCGIWIRFYVHKKQLCSNLLSTY